MSNTTNNCNGPVYSQDFGNNAGAIAESMGMNQVCKQQAISSGQSFAAAFKANTPIGGAGAAIAATNFDDKMSQSGCGQAYANMEKVALYTQNINCIINQNSSSASGSQGTINQISIQALPLTQAEIKAQTYATNQFMTAQTQMLNLIKLYPNATTLIKQLIQNNNNLMNFVLRSYKRDVNINNTSISQIVNLKIKNKTTFQGNSASTIAAKQNAIAKSTAQQHLQTQLGTNALSPQIKSLIVSQINNRQTFTSQTVQKTADNISTTINTSNVLNISAAGNINLTNVKIDQNIHATIMTQVFVKQASSVGVQIAQTIMGSASAAVTSKTKSAGADALIKALGNANTNAINANNAGLVGYGVFGFIIFGVLILGAKMFTNMFGGGSSEGGNQTLSEGGGLSYKIFRIIWVGTLLVFGSSFIPFIHPNIQNQMHLWSLVIFFMCLFIYLYLRIKLSYRRRSRTVFLPPQEIYLRERQSTNAADQGTL